MTNFVKLSCSITTNDSTVPLGLEIRLDNQPIFLTTHVIDPINFEYDMPDDEGEHLLQFIMTGKTQEHTKIDENNNIISDARLTIGNLEFDEIELGIMFIDHSVYSHDFNGTGKTTEEKFYGEMGCNGTVGLNFSTPIYMWLLENM